jgi:ABC-type dipeptide/oligopeptide/nickel transport system ATPase component
MTQLVPTSPAQVPATSADTYVVPAPTADLGDQAGRRYVEFFTANIRNPNTRRACARFLAWRDGREVAMIFQEPMTSLNPMLTIGLQISEVLRHHQGLSRRHLSPGGDVQRLHGGQLAHARSAHQRRKSPHARA